MYIYLNRKILALEFMDGGQRVSDMKGMFFTPVLSPMEIPYDPSILNLEASGIDISENPV